MLSLHKVETRVDLLKNGNERHHCLLSSYQVHGPWPVNKTSVMNLLMTFNRPGKCRIMTVPHGCLEHATLDGRCSSLAHVAAWPMPTSMVRRVGDPVNHAKT